MTASPVNQATTAPARRGWPWRGGLLAALVALSAAAWLAWQRFETRRVVGQAERLAERGPFAEAEPALRAALHRDPDNAELLRFLALGLLGSERLAEAEPALARLGELRPDDPQPYRLLMYARHRDSHLGKTEAERQRLQELALADGRRALELSPDDESAAREVIWLCLGLGRFDEAERLCLRWRERRPDELWFVYLQARACHGRGAGKEAQSMLDALLRHQPQFTRGQLLRAILYHEADEPEKAIPLLREVIDRDSARQQEARYHLSLALARAGHGEEARRLMTEVQRNNLEQVTARAGHADQPAVQVRRGELLLAAGKIDEALAVLQAVRKDDPNYPGVHRLLASCYARKGESRKAEEHRRQAER
jgi:predicted Zn-dependent protease